MFKMTPNILRNFLAPKATRLHPYKTRTPFENARGEIQNDILTCKFCGLCAAKCPSQCITVDKKSALWTCDPHACVYCGTCVEACPTRSLQQKKECRPPTPQKQVILLKGEIKKKAEKQPIDPD
jgi:formate hydrogenlyase subunit 6/NADH:ubiquinone oxidoreductase subunit I